MNRRRSPRLLMVPLLGLAIGLMFFDRAPTAAEGGRPTLDVTRDLSSRLHAAPAVGDTTQSLFQVEELITLDFEDPTFPPEGWQLLDNVAKVVAPGGANHWSRQTCEVPQDGGTASAWSAGGGSEGEALTCGDNIGKGTEPWLVNTNVDLSSSPGGLQIDFNAWLDTPIGQGLYVCVAAEGVTRFDCANLALRTEAQRAVWLELTNPIYFPETAGQPLVQVAFVFNDAAGTGDYQGVFLDNVVISGLLEAPPTSEATATRTTRVTPTRTATRPRFTATPTSRPTQDGRQVYLPILMANDSGFRDPQVRISFGAADDNNGHVSNPGHHFQYGMMSLCAEISWSGFSGDTELRWQWYRLVNGQFEPFGSATMNDYVRVGGESEPYIVPPCFGSADDNGVPEPLPVNNYRLDVTDNKTGALYNSQVARITDDVPPGKTPVGPTLTPGPTGAASVTPKATPSGPGQRKQLENGDFERGPSVAWSLRTNVLAPNNTTDRVIRLNTEALTNPPAQMGEYAAYLGGSEQVHDQLLSESWDLPEASEVISASFNMTFGMLTDEVKDMTHDDTLLVFVLSQDGVDEVLPNSGFSEEVIDAGSLYNLEEAIDVSGFFSQRDDWTSAQLGFDSVNSDAAVSIHILDNIVLELTTSSLFGLPPAFTRRMPMRSFSPVPLRAVRRNLAAGMADGLRLGSATGALRASPTDGGRLSVR